MWDVTGVPWGELFPKIYESKDELTLPRFRAVKKKLRRRTTGVSIIELATSDDIKALIEGITTPEGSDEDEQPGSVAPTPARSGGSTGSKRNRPASGGSGKLSAAAAIAKAMKQQG